MPLEQFEARMQELVGLMKSSTPAKGYEEVIMAGEPEWRNEVFRRQDGIPISDGTWEKLTAMAERFQIPVPAAQ